MDRNTITALLLVTLVLIVTPYYIKLVSPEVEQAQEYLEDATDLDERRITYLEYDNTQEQKRVVTKTTTLSLYFNRWLNIYKFGTVTLALIQQFNLIEVPALPSVKMSVLVGALPSYDCAAFSAFFFREASTFPAFLATFAANQ